jgi:hypothetical protein
VPDDDSFLIDVQRIQGGSAAKNDTAKTAKSSNRRYDVLDSIPDQDESFKLNIKTVEDTQPDAEDGSGQRLATFA